MSAARSGPGSPKWAPRQSSASTTASCSSASPSTITRSDKGIIREIDGRPAMEVLLGDLPEQQRADLTTLRGRLFAGLAAADGSAFVMRHVLGTDPRTGALAVAGRPQLGAEVMFSMLDGAAARDDLEATLHSLSQTLQGRRPEAVLLFDCAARGEPLMGVPLYDVERTIDVLGHGERVPVVGLMGGGEIARLDTITQVFGYTVVVAALLRPD
jgi:small ligand-binding sensory domain FIST